MREKVLTVMSRKVSKMKLVVNMLFFVSKNEKFVFRFDDMSFLPLQEIKPRLPVT